MKYQGEAKRIIDYRLPIVDAPPFSSRRESVRSQFLTSRSFIARYFVYGPTFITARCAVEPFPHISLRSDLLSYLAAASPHIVGGLILP
jgi:hypothetical protein